jgi:hypothetical protein
VDEPHAVEERIGPLRLDFRPLDEIEMFRLPLGQVVVHAEGVYQIPAASALSQAEAD